MNVKVSRAAMVEPVLTYQMGITAFALPATTILTAKMVNRSWLYLQN